MSTSCPHHFPQMDRFSYVVNIKLLVDIKPFGEPVPSSSQRVFQGRTTPCSTSKKSLHEASSSETVEEVH